MELRTAGEGGGGGGGGDTAGDRQAGGAGGAFWVEYLVAAVAGLTPARSRIRNPRVERAALSETPRFASAVCPPP
jgi:hypothetical protein